MTTIQVLCATCKHFRDDVEDENVCEAFPDGIPEEIITDEFDHREPHPDDNGIQYEPREQE